MNRFFEIAARLQAAGAGEALAMIVLKATLILLIARLLLAAIPRAAAATRHAVAAVALCSTVALLLLAPILPAWNVAVFEAPQEAAISNALVPAADEFAGAGSGRQPAATAAEPATPIRALSAIQSLIRLTSSTWKGAAVLILLGGAIAFIAQMLAGMAGVWLVARTAVELEDDATLLAFDEACDQLALRRDVRLLRSPRITVPVVWGVIRPMLLLPADCVAWPAERMRVVLLHELAHLKRIDGVTLLMTRLAVSLYWFHPLAWSLERAGRGACEQACDDIVLASGTKPSDYADHLLHLAKALPSFDPFRSVTLAMSRRSQLEGRLVAILQTRVHRGTFTARGVAMAIIVAALVVVPISAVRLIAQPAEKKKEIKADSVIDVTPDLEKLSGMFSGDDDEEKYKSDTKHGNDLSTGDGWYEYGGELFSNERYQDAIAAYQEAIKRGHNTEAAAYNIACSYSLMDDKDHALEWLQEAIGAGFDDLDHIAEDDDLDPIRSDPRFARIVNDPEGRSQLRLEHVLQRYRELKQQGTDNPDDWCSNGLELLKLRRLDEAIDAFQQSAKYPENRPEALYKLGMAYSMKGDGERAVDAVRESIQRGHGGDDKFKGPEFAALRRSPSFAELQRLSKDLQMVSCCDKGASYKPWLMQSYEDAYQHHKAIAARYPNQPRALFNLGFMALRAEHFQEGIDAFQRCVGMNYRVGTSSYNAGCGYALAGNADAAMQWLERARNAGFELHGYIDDDDDLDNIRGDQRFKALRRAVKSDSEKEHSE
jgi:beta-lactamase regulating signal transducer with metallopeptidase domain